MKLEIISISLFIVLLVYTGCEQSTEPDNRAPKISEILINNQPVTVNAWVDLTAIATDADGDSLSYYWIASAGIINSYEITNNPTTWRSPDSLGTYIVTCTVSDGKETDTKSITISVN